MVSETQAVVYRKLVRDRIPEIIEAGGGSAECWTLEPAADVAALIRKLHEEAGELERSARGELAEELADLWEVLNALADALEVRPDDIEAAARRKREARGGFADRLWLERVLPIKRD